MHTGEKDKTMSRLKAHEETCKMIMVATEGFSTETDFADVCLVLFAGGARNILDFWQAAGRAGRDGAPAEVRVLYNKRHVDRSGG